MSQSLRARGVDAGWAQGLGTNNQSVDRDHLCPIVWLVSSAKAEPGCRAFPTAEATGVGAAGAKHLQKPRPTHRHSSSILLHSTRIQPAAACRCFSPDTGYSKPPIDQLLPALSPAGRPPTALSSALLCSLRSHRAQRKRVTLLRQLIATSRIASHRALHSPV
ncbi:hypothetical protein LSTR_LSTR009552 [Laodelphax striatellus]|uniref:Uncharacterized protein n=1 Tax=Laodelphax striatellus TaxID=195883 RepID=A0A482WT46_LAOST|nr:hypothetical protein LSTR_LSTR009552 [Laodelphax striatellus]